MDGAQADDRDCQSSSSFSMTELKKTTKRLPVEKAPSSDGVLNEILRAFTEKTQRHDFRCSISV